MENSTEIFQMALGLSSPWFVSSVQFKEVNGSNELHIDISFVRGSKFLGKDGKKYTAHDTVKRTWQHMNFFEHKCFIHSRVPRIREKSGSTHNQEVPWARKGSGFTLLFEAFSMLLIENEMPVKKAASIVSVYPQRLWNVFSHWVNKAHENDNIGPVSALGFDETSSKKGHQYVTTMVDMSTRRVLFATIGKSSNCIGESVKYLKNKGVEISKVDNVCIDMSPAFISGCGTYLPTTAITFDKFHVIKEVYSAMDELRLFERKEHELLAGHKYTFLKTKLHETLFEERDFFLEYYPKLGEGYRLVQLFKDFWDMKDKEEAESFLAYWCDQAYESGIGPFKRVANMVNAHWSGIINYIESRISNGVLEGINSKIQLVKKRARGYRNIQNFINMIYFTCGKLEFDYPRYSI